ncbi:DUF1524 domain-containing protein [Streptomyces sp. DG2A-72]|nr:DUF1524 domain-containing protein [Streptomyces sp. DG2A-72]MDO0932325.1 DUF1524 domain-containing protein [Streptomyces sp. DG2A-72]
MLPQRPNQKWYELLAEEADDGQSAEELHTQLVHTLGNLTLSVDNARLSNHPFRRKQEILDSSALRMNQWIADQERWGKAQILARADELAERAVTLWPGPIDGMRQADEWPGWKDLRAALLAMPAGTWTTYGDVGALVGTHAVAVGQHLAGKPGIHGAHRVLTSDGRVSEGSAGRTTGRQATRETSCGRGDRCRHPVAFIKNMPLPRVVTLPKYDRSIPSRKPIYRRSHTPKARPPSPEGKPRALVPTGALCHAPRSLRSSSRPGSPMPSAPSAARCPGWR